MVLNFLSKLLLPTIVFAAFSFQIDSLSVASVTSEDDEVDVSLSIDSLPDGDSYFRVGMDSGGTYVGYMQDNTGSWVKLDTLSSDKANVQCSRYYKINADGNYTLKFKIGDDFDIENGAHSIKVHRFTTSCNYSSGNELAITVALPTPEPTPTPSPTPEPTEKPTSTPKPTTSPTPVATIYRAATPKPSPKPSPQSTISPTGLDPVGGEANLVLGVQEVASPSPTVSSEPTKTGQNIPIPALLFTLGGVGFIGAGVYPFAKNYLKRYTKQSVTNEEELTS